MRSYGTTKEQALARIDDIRMKVGAPVVWVNDPGRKDAYLRDCASQLLKPFPADRRDALVATLTNLKPPSTP